MCLGQGLGVSVQLKKFQHLFRGFGIFSEIVRVTLFWDILYIEQPVNSSEIHRLID